MLGVFSSKAPITLSGGFSVETLTGVSLPWKTEYPDDCSTVGRYVVRKVGLYNLKMISLWGCNFWIDGLAYDKNQLRHHLYLGTFLVFNSLNP